MLKTTYMVVAAALFSTGVATTTETISTRASTAAVAIGDNVVARAPWQAKDPADSLYQAARVALAKGDYTKAADLFRRVTTEYPNSDYAGESLYYLAFANYRIGGTDRLRAALSSLTTLQDRFPKVAKSGDARTLRTRVCGELARQGDEGCAAEVAAAAQAVTSAEPVTAAAEARAAAAEARAESSADRASIDAIKKTRSSRASGCPSADDEDDDRIAALNALLQMDADRALPILKAVLARRDACSAALRSKAVFLVSQKRTPETADLLLSIARSDPDEEVREQAVFWLSQVPDERAVTMLQDILATSSNEDLKNKALFALSQHHSPKAAQFLRDFALRENESDELRGQAIFWLGQRHSGNDAEFLRSLYSRVRSDDVKEKILFSVSQQRGVGNEQWLLDIVKNPNENIELRKKALFWAGQGGATAEQLSSLYSTLNNSEMREQLIFVYSQRRDPAMVNKLLDIAKNDKDPDLRKKAIFWLGQSRDPRVQQFLIDLINK